MSITECQKEIKDWTSLCFGEAIATNIQERNYRFLEEALELVQAGGLSKREAHELLDYVYDRPTGEIRQEIGGTFVTLAALCNANGINLEEAAINEQERCAANIDKIRAKHKNKKFKI